MNCPAQKMSSPAKHASFPMLFIIMADMLHQKFHLTMEFCVNIIIQYCLAKSHNLI